MMNKDTRRPIPPPSVPPPRLPGSPLTIQKYQLSSSQNGAIEQSNPVFTQPLSQNIAPPPQPRTTSLRKYSVKG